MRDREPLQNVTPGSATTQLPRLGRGEGARVEEWLKFVRCNRRILEQRVP
jgi:hypothetical protein